MCQNRVQKCKKYSLQKYNADCDIKYTCINTKEE